MRLIRDACALARLPPQATRLSGIEGFAAKENGLRPLRVEQWGHLVLVNAAAGGAGAPPDPPRHPAADPESNRDDSNAAASFDPSVAGSFESIVADAAAAGALRCFRDPLRFVERREYDIKCNWKTFCNNYLDGGCVPGSTPQYPSDETPTLPLLDDRRLPVHCCAYCACCG